MIENLVIVGCGGLGREVWSIVSALSRPDKPWIVEGFADDAATEESRELAQRLGTNFVGTISDLAARRSSFAAVLAIGLPMARAQVYRRLSKSPVAFPRLVHPDTTIGHGVELGEGVIIAPGARLSTDIRVGSQVHIDQNVTIGHDTVIGAFSRLNPQACISGSVIIGDRVLVGASATILQGLRIGESSTIGAGACVVTDVSPGTTVKGVPAR